MELKDYIGIFKRHLLLFVVVFSIFVGGQVANVYIRPVQFEATTSVLLTSSPLSESILEDLPIYYTPVGVKLSLLARSELVNSKEVLNLAHEKMLKEDNALAINERKNYGGIFEKSSELRGCFSSKSDATGEKLVITAVHQDADIAVDIANSVVAAYAEYSIQLGKENLDKAEQVLFEQKERVSEEIDASKADLIVKSDVDLEQQEVELNANIASLQGRYSQLESRIREEESNIRLKFWEKNWREDNAAANYEEMFVEMTRTLDEIRSLIRERKLIIRRLQLKYTDNHPKIISEQTDLAFLQEQLEVEKGMIMEQQVGDLDRDIFRRKLSKQFLEDELIELGDALIQKKSERREMSKKFIDYRQKKARLDRANTAFEKLEISLNALRLRKDVETGDVKKSLTKDARKLGRKGKEAIWAVAVLGFLAGLGIIYLVEYLDTRVATEHDIRKHLNLPVLARVPKMKGGILLTDITPTHRISELFTTSATLINAMATDMGLKTFLVCSTREQEGKSTISVNLAIALARKGKRVVLVDADLRLPTIHEFMGLRNTFGLSSVLEGRLEAQQALSDLTDEGAGAGLGNLESVLFPTNIPNLRVLPSGPTPADPVGLLESVRMRQLVEDIKGLCDIAIFDTPPIYNVGDTLIVSSLIDAHLFVVGSGETEQHEVNWAKHLLNNVEANILGVFLNKVMRDAKEYSYYYYDRKSYRVQT